MSEKYLPECWQDDARMNALFSPFRTREANPQDWESKLHFWKSSIWQWSRATKRGCFSVNEVLTAFQRNGKTPQGLRTAVNELLRQKELVKFSDFGELEDSKWLTWGLNVLVKKPLTWSLSALGNALVKKDEENDDDEYFIMEIIKEKANEVLKLHQSKVEFESTDHIVEMNVLYEQCSGFCTSEIEFQAVILHLRRQKCISAHINNDVKLIKFKREQEKAASAITEVDIGILRLKRSREFLQKRVSKLQENIDDYVSEAKMHLKQNSRPMAKAALRRKRNSEKVLAKRETALENVEELLHRIQDVESEKMVISAYRAGVDGFRNTLAESGITVDNVDDTMIAIQDMFDMHEEIQDTISTPIGGEDISELEMELEELMLSPEPPPAPLGPSPPSDFDGRKRDNSKTADSSQEDKLSLPSAIEDPLPDVPSSAAPTPSAAAAAVLQ